MRYSMPPCLYIQIGLIVLMQEWDTYLTEYATSLPISRDRAGIFRPLSNSFWDRLFPWMHRSKPPIVSDYLFPPDDKYTAPSHLSFHHRQNSEQPAIQPALTLDNYTYFPRKHTQDPLARLRGLKNAGGNGYRKREAVKFGAMNPDDFSSDDEDDPLSTLPPPARRASTLSSATLTNGSNAGSWGNSPMKGDQERVASTRRVVFRGKDSDAPEYSDYEEDVTNAQTQPEEYRNSPSWEPPRHGSNTAHPESSVGAVPMTPSLIRAVDRITAAQAQAYGSSSPDTSAASPEVDRGSVSVRKQRWEAFWRDVTAKASEGTNAR